MSVRRLSVFLGDAALALPLAAGANGPTGDPSCWGQASAAFAQSAPGALGEHASSPPPIDLNGAQPGPTGLGNIAQLFDAHAFAWLHNFKRLLVRYDRRHEIHEAFLALGCCLVCFRRLQRSL